MTPGMPDAANASLSGAQDPAARRPFVALLSDPDEVELLADELTRRLDVYDTERDHGLKDLARLDAQRAEVEHALGELDRRRSGVAAALESLAPFRRDPEPPVIPAPPTAPDRAAYR